MANSGGGVSALVKPVSAETAQEPWELEQLLTLVDRWELHRILEIGVWHGGTLWHWLHVAKGVVAVDDTMFEAGDWKDWSHQQGMGWLELHQGDSHDPAIIGRVQALGPYDLIHIDAAHDYDAVRGDWENYGPLIAPGGVVVFHDIAERASYGVSRLWADLKPGRRTLEIWGGVPSYCGIGVLFT